MQKIRNDFINRVLYRFYNESFNYKINDYNYLSIFIKRL